MWVDRWSRCRPGRALTRGKVRRARFRPACAAPGGPSPSFTARTPPIRTIGRKLWLFFHGDVTVERAARLASLLATARLHGAGELKFLRWLLQELTRRECSIAAAARLLPDAWMAAKNKKAEEGSAVDA